MIICDAGLCTDCAKCIKVCPTDALKFPALNDAAAATTSFGSNGSGPTGARLTGGGWSQVVRFEDWSGSVDPGTGLTTLRYRSGPSCWDVLTGVMSFDTSGRAVGSGTLSATCNLALPGTPVGTWTAERD